MALIQKNNRTSNPSQLRVERAVWMLIYGGLLAIVLGYFVDQQGAQDASLFYNLGGLAVAVGVILIVVRSRMQHKD